MDMYLNNLMRSQDSFYYSVVIRLFDSILGILFGGMLGIRFILFHSIVRLNEILLNNVCVL